MKKFSLFNVGFNSTGQIKIICRLNLPFHVQPVLSMGNTYSRKLAMGNTYSRNRRKDKNLKCRTRHGGSSL